MKVIALLVLFAVLLATNALAYMNCNTFGNMTTCSDGYGNTTTCTTFGNMTTCN